MFTLSQGLKAFPLFSYSYNLGTNSTVLQDESIQAGFISNESKEQKFELKAVVPPAAYKRYENLVPVISLFSYSKLMALF